MSSPFRLVLATALLVGLVSCDSSRPAGPAAGQPPGNSNHGTRAASSSTGTPGDVTVTDAANGTTVSMHIGGRLRVVLRSTYWRFAAVAGGVLEPTDVPVTAPSPSGCLPGGGCGTVTEVFRAKAAGEARITASRTSCGEAYACPPGRGSFTLTVVVH